MSRPMPSYRPAVPAYRPPMPSYRPSPSINRSPSLSRPSTRPTIPSQRPSGGVNRPSTRPSAPGLAGGARPGGGTGPGLSPGAAAGRPTAGDVGSFLEMTPREVTTADRQRIHESFNDYYRGLAEMKANRGASGLSESGVGERAANVGDRLPASGERLQNRASDLTNRQANIGDRMSNRQDYRSQLSDNTQNRQQQRQDWASSVRENCEGGRWNDWWNDFQDDFGEPGWRLEYPRMANAYFRANHPYGYWWGWSNAAALSGWYVGWWSTPYYYDYGYGGNVYYGDEGVAYDGQTYTPEDYAQSAEDQAAQGESEVETPPADGSQTDWLPLGVFALSTSEEEKSPTRLMQLAVSKQGTINGTLTNTETNDIQPIVGSIDRKTQRACWYAGDKKDVVAETGVFNLTNDSAPVLVHFGSDRTEEYLLVRVPKPSGEADQADPTKAAKPAD